MEEELSKKEKCKKIMMKFFGPATAETVDAMSESECVEKCKQKVASFYGAHNAKEFDEIQ